MPIAEINGIETFYDDMGIGKPIIFIHGLGLDSRVFEQRSGLLSQRVRLIYYDLRGHGRTFAPQTGYSYDDFAADLKALAEHLRLKTFHLVGLSMGGAIAARLALENPELVRSITFIGSHIVGYSQFKDWPNMYKIAKNEGVDKAREVWKNFRLFDNVRADTQKSKLFASMVDHFSCAMWLDPNPRYDEPNDLERISDLKMPALVTAGKDDSDFHPVAEILKDKLPNPRFEEFESGHLVSFEQPQEFNQLLLDFLDSVREE